MWQLYRDGTVALVTGGSRGIGRAIALELAKENVDVIVHYHGNEKKALDVRDEIRRMGRRSIVLKADMRESKEISEMFKTIKQTFGKLDILINNAGIVDDGFLLMMSDQKFMNVLEVNLNGYFKTTKEALRLMIKEQKGVIINVSSTSGMVGQEGQVNYSASKAGIIALTKVTAKEYADKGIRCNAIAPGFINTDMTSSKGDISLVEKFGKYIPLKRFGEPQDVANAVVFLASDKAAYITGKTIVIDGGLISQ